jgi:hypothetical protein
MSGRCSLNADLASRPAVFDQAAAPFLEPEGLGAGILLLRRLRLQLAEPCHQPDPVHRSRLAEVGIPLHRYEYRPLFIGQPVEVGTSE